MSHGAARPTTNGNNSNNRYRKDTKSLSKQRIIVAAAGTTDVPLAIKILSAIRKLDFEIHLVLSAQQTSNDSESEESREFAHLQALANSVYFDTDSKALIEHSSFRADAMIVLDCDGPNLAAIAKGSQDDLTSRAAYVMLKKHGKLVLLPREQPVETTQFQDVISITKAGGLVLPSRSVISAETRATDGVVDELVASLLEKSVRWNKD